MKTTRRWPTSKVDTDAEIEEPTSVEVGLFDQLQASLSGTH